MTIDNDMCDNNSKGNLKSVTNFLNPAQLNSIDKGKLDQEVTNFFPIKKKKSFYFGQGYHPFRHY